MTKKQKKIMTWALVIIMVSSVILGFLAYFIR